MTTEHPQERAAFLQLLGEVVELGGMIEFNLTLMLAGMVTQGNANLGLLVVGGENVEWMADKVKRFGAQYQRFDSAAGLADWATECRTAFERRNRLFHDFQAYGTHGRTAMRIPRKGTGSDLVTLRPGAVQEARDTRAALQRVMEGLARLHLRLAQRKYRF